MPSRLILHADDFGLTPGINRGILELHLAGVLTSASLIATAPHFEQAAEIARANTALGVGCHITFVDGIPAAHPESIPTLLGADGKTFRPSLLDFTQAVLRRTIRPADIAREAQAQIQRLQRAGLDVTHVDTHKHTHVFPVIAHTLLHIAQRCGVHAIRNPFEPIWSAQLANAPLLRRAQLHLVRRFEPSFLTRLQLVSQEILTTQGTLGIAATGTLTPATLHSTLAGIPPDSLYELCSHPGHVDAALAEVQTRLRTSREQEFHTLLTVIPDILRTQSPPELIHYGNLGVAGLQRASGQFQPNTGYEKVT